MTAVSIDGALVAPEHASISVFDRGLLYGDGCFEVLRSWHGRLPDLEAHLDRLYEAARFLSLTTIARDQLVDAVRKTVAACPVDHHRLRIVLTRGPGSLTEPVSTLGPGRAIVVAEPLGDQPRELAAAVVDWPVIGRGRGRKLLSYVDHVIARELARAAGADEAIRLDHAGYVVEGATSNLYAVIDGRVVTPATECGALPGIVRAHVLALCARAGIAVDCRRLAVGELTTADELFASSSLRGVVPITRLDDRRLVGGPLTHTIATAYLATMNAVANDSA